MAWITVRRLSDNALIGPLANRDAAETWMRADWQDFCLGAFDPADYVILDLRDPAEQLDRDRIPARLASLPIPRPAAAWDSPRRVR